MARASADEVFAIVRYHVLRDKEGLIRRLQQCLLTMDEHRLCRVGVGTSGYASLSFRVPWRNEPVKVYAHHLFFVLREGRSVGPGMEVDHECNIRNCVVHLSEQTRKRNMELQHERRKARQDQASKAA